MNQFPLDLAATFGFAHHLKRAIYINYPCALAKMEDKTNKNSLEIHEYVHSLDVNCQLDVHLRHHVQQYRKE
jgi:hypothetical protein